MLSQRSTGAPPRVVGDAPPRTPSKYEQTENHATADLTVCVKERFAHIADARNALRQHLLDMTHEVLSSRDQPLAVGPRAFSCGFAFGPHGDGVGGFVPYNGG